MANIPTSSTPPQAISDFTTTYQGTGVELDLLKNDQSSEALPLKIIRVTKPEHGVVEILPSGLVKYAPNPEHLGIDSFEYVAKSKAGSSNPTKVTVMITPLHDNQSATAQRDSVDTSINAVEDMPLAVAEITAIEQAEPSHQSDELPLNSSADPAHIDNDSQVEESPAIAATITLQTPSPVNNDTAPSEPVAVEQSPIISDDPSLLIQHAYLCLEEGNQECAVQNCNRIAEVLEEREMTSLCGTLFDPSIVENTTGSDPRHAFRYYLKAKQLGGEMHENLSQLSDWLINHQQFSKLGEEIQTELSENR